MKIRTQYNLTLVVFGAILFIILASMVATHLKIKRLQKQGDLVTRIEKNVRDITYLSNEYLVYHESQYLRRWEAQYSSISTFLANLQVDSSDKKVHLDHIKTNLQRVKEVFADTVSTLENISPIQNNQAHAALARTLWSRMGVQNQEMAFAASGLLRLINNEESRLNQINTVLIICLIGACGIYIGASNYLIYRRTLKSISLFQTGTKIIGAGNLEYFIEDNNDDEIGGLCRDFNEMTRKLGRSYNNLENEIAERKQAESALRDSERLYRAIGESIDYGVWVCAPDGHCTYASESFLGMVGMTQEQCSNFGWGDVLHPDDAENTISAWKECVRSEGVWDIEHRFRGTDGQWHAVLARGVPVRNDSGEVIFWAGINLDISRMKQAEESLRNSENKFSILFNKASLPVVLSRFPDHVFVDVNDAWTNLFGYTKEESIGKTSLELGINRDAERRARMIAEVRWHEQVFNLEQTLYSKSGDALTVLTNVNVITIGGQEYALTSIQDITERKRAEDELRASEEKFSTMLQAAPIAIALAALPDGVLYNVNPAWLDLTGIARKEDAIGKTSLELGLIGDPAQRESILSEFRQNGFVRNFELAFCSRKGVQRTVLVNLDRVEIGGRAFILSTMEEITERKRAEEELQHANENLEFRVRERTAELLTAMDALSGEIAERKLVEEELQTANSTMRRLLRTIAHEFRTPLGLLTGTTDILDLYWDRLTPEKRLEQNEHIRNAARQMSNLVNSVTSFQLSGTDRQTNPPLLQDMEDLCRSIAEEVETVWGAGHEFVVSIAADCGTAVLDDILFRRVLQNLLTNAFRYTPSTGTVSLHVCREKGLLLLEITDTGIGIPKEEQEFIFDAFYRSRNVEGRRGLGLGLSIVREALSQMGGTILVTSSTGDGTTMRVEIPVVDSV